MAKTKTDTKKKIQYVRFTEKEEQLIRERATREDRPMAQIIQRAVRAYLDLPILEEPEPSADEIVGRWFNDLPNEVRLSLWKISEALSSDSQPPEQLRRSLGIPELAGRSRKGKAR